MDKPLPGLPVPGDPLESGNNLDLSGSEALEDMEGSAFARDAIASLIR